MKKLITLLLLAPLIGFAQTHLITYEDDGREVPVLADSKEEAVGLVTMLIEDGYTKIQLGEWEAYETIVETTYSIGPPTGGVMYSVVWLEDGVSHIFKHSNIVDVERVLTEKMAYSPKAGNWKLSDLIKTTKVKIITRP